MEEFILGGVFSLYVLLFCILEAVCFACTPRDTYVRAGARNGLSHTLLKSNLCSTPRSQLFFSGRCGGFAKIGF